MNGLLVQSRNAAVITRLGRPQRERLARELDEWDVRTIVVGPVGGPPGGDVRVLTFLTTLLGRAPEQVEDVHVWWDVDPAEVAAIEDPPLGGTKAAKQAAAEQAKAAKAARDKAAKARAAKSKGKAKSKSKAKAKASSKRSKR